MVPWRSLHLTARTKHKEGEPMRLKDAFAKGLQCVKTAFVGIAIVQFSFGGLLVGSAEAKETRKRQEPAFGRDYQCGWHARAALLKGSAIPGYGAVQNGILHQLEQEREGAIHDAAGSHPELFAQPRRLDHRF